jgi:hypothetical protein
MLGDPVASERIFDTFIYELTPADEINGIHTALRKAAFREIVLGRAANKDNYGYNNDDDNRTESINSIESVFPIELFLTTLEVAKTFYEKYLLMFNYIEEKTKGYSTHQKLKDQYMSAYKDSEAETELFLNLLRDK